MNSVGTPCSTAGRTLRIVSIRSSMSRGLGTTAIGQRATSDVFNAMLPYTWNIGITRVTISSQSASAVRP